MNQTIPPTSIGPTTVNDTGAPSNYQAVSKEVFTKWLKVTTRNVHPTPHFLSDRSGMYSDWKDLTTREIVARTVSPFGPRVIATYFLRRDIAKEMM